MSIDAHSGPRNPKSLYVIHPGSSAPAEKAAAAGAAGAAASAVAASRGRKMKLGVFKLMPPST